VQFVVHPQKQQARCPSPPSFNQPNNQPTNPNPKPNSQVLSPSYAAAAHQIGEALRQAYSHKPPMDRAAEEVELAMLHGGYSIEHSLRGAARHEAAGRGGAGAAAATTKHEEL